MSPIYNLSPAARELLSNSPVPPAQPYIAVLVLLRHNFIPDAEMLAGCPVQYGPPPYTGLPFPVARRQSSDDRRIVRLNRNPQLPRGFGLVSPAFQRYRRLRVGMSIAQALRRGVTRQDIAAAQRRGWLELAP